MLYTDKYIHGISRRVNKRSYNFSLFTVTVNKAGMNPSLPGWSKQTTQDIAAYQQL